MDGGAYEARDVYRKMLGVLEQGHPAAVYLPWFYRSVPPYLFLFRDSARALLKRSEIDGFCGRAAIFLEQGYRFAGPARCRIAYRFEEGGDFRLQLEGCWMRKELEGEEAWLRELELFLSKLGLFGVVPLLRLEEEPVESGGIEAGPELRIKHLAEGLPLPSYAHPGDAGLDLRSAEDAVLEPGAFALLSTGFSMSLPEGYAAFVQPRSGLAAKHGISIVNTPGLIDCHYRGEVKVILINHGKEPFRVNRGDRIAQMVIQEVCAARVSEVEELDATRRGEGGFGSTGV
jgi:dUTP pyrophosphatase